MRNSLYKKILLMLAIVVNTAMAMAQNSEIFGETTYIRTYGINEFGRLLFVNDIAEDSNGSILLGTSDGVSVLTSSGSTFLTSANHSGIQRILSTADGKIMVSGDVDNGYFEFAPTGKEIYHDINSNDALSSDVILCIAPFQNSYCYIGRSAIHIYNGAVVRRVKFSNIQSAFCIDTIPLIVSTDAKLHTFDGLFTKEILSISKLDISNPQDIKIVDMQNDSIAIISSTVAYTLPKHKLTEGKYLSDNDFSIHKIDIPDLAGISIRDAQYDRMINKLALSTNKGIFILNGDFKHINTISRYNRLPSEDVHKLFFDSKHNLWASLSSILVKIELNTPTVYYGEEQGLKGDIYYFEKYKGQYYCSTFNDVYTTITEDGKTVFKKVDFEENITCWNIQNFEGHLLACTINGLYEIEGTKAHKILNSGKIYSIASSPILPDKILMASYDGLVMADYRIENGKLIFGKPYKAKNLNIPVWDIEVDKNGMLWLSTIFNGIYYLVPKDTKLERFSLVNIGDNIGFQELRQPKFYITDKYLYTYGHRLARATLPDKIDFMAKDIKLEESELFAQYIKNMDSTETFHLNTKGDVFINSKDNYTIAYRDSKTFEKVHFQTQINMINNVFMEDSLLFLSTDIGLIKHNTKFKPQHTPDTYPFNALISGIYVNDSAIYNGTRYFGDKAPREYSLSKNEFHNLGSNIKSLKIKYTSTCFENSDRITYQYQLDGFSDGWSNPSSDDNINFGQLKPGNYTFRVRAMNHYGVISNEAVFHFRIECVIYLRWWAILIYALILGSQVYYFGRRLYFYKKENARLDIINRKQFDEIKLLSMVASQNSNSVMILDRNGDILWENESFRNFYGYSPQEFKDANGNNFFLIHKKISEANSGMIDSAISDQCKISYEVVHTGPDGQNVYAHTYLDPVLDQNGNLSHWIVTESDITQLKLAEKEGMKQAEAIVSAYNDLQKNQSKMEFTTRQLRTMYERLENGYKEINRQNITINQSLRYAQGLQNSILPSPEKFNEVIDYSLMYWPKDIVSGDFYVCLNISEQTFFTVVADCTGHGVPGAFMSIIGYDILCQLIIYHKHNNPAEILELLSKRMIDMLDMKRIQNTDGIALSICRFDKHQDHVDITFAGSDSSIYIHKTADNTLLKLKGSRRQTGINGEIFNHKPFEQETHQISYSDRIIQYSDGIIDQCNGMRRRYGTPRFEKMILENADKPITDLATSIESDLTIYMDNSEQRDDITVLAFNIKK